MAVLYILESEQNGSYYIGSTEDLERRVTEHNEGNTKSTRYKRPWRIVFKQEYKTIEEAKRIESKLKKMKSRKIIEKIIVNQKITIK